MKTIPTINQLYTSILSDLETAYGSTIPLFGKNFLRAQALVQAGKLKLIYLGLGKIQKNIFVDTADPEASGGTLERFGRIKLGRNPFQATAGQYTVEITGTVGAIIKAGTVFKSNDDALNASKLFVLDSEYELVSATDSIVLRALEAGTDSKLLVDDQLTATSPITNVNKTAIVTAETVEPLAAEDIEDYRTKTTESFRLEAQGGAASDYRLWASDAQGVEKVYAYARSGYSNEVNVFVEATIDDSTDGKGTPSGALLSDVEDVIDFDPDTTKPLEERGRRPLGAIVNVLPITVKEIDIVISDFVGITVEIENQIFDEIETQLALVRPFVAGADVVDLRNDIFDINRIISIILNVRPGSVFGEIDLQVDSVSVSTFTFQNGDIPHLNSITYA